MRASHACTFAMLFALVACSGKHRPFADTTPIEGLGGSSLVDTPAAGGNEAPSPEPGVEPSATGGEPLGGRPVATLSPPDAAVQNSETLGCESDAAACTSPDAGPNPVGCIPSGLRNCTSDLDNDCDGQLDNALDDVCRCTPGTGEICDEHPGLDGRGQCRAGVRTCVGADGNLSSNWGPCEGAQGPQRADSCVPQDDADCDGLANEGCDCVDGVTQPCGPPNDLGVCQRGTQTCVSGSFGPCMGPIFGAARDCRSAADNDCDGRPDNNLDNICTCTIGSSEACRQHSQDGVGSCRAGQRQCLAGQGSSSSFFGECTGEVGPLQRDACTSVNDADCDGLTNDGCACVSSRGNADCSNNPDNGRCNGATGQCVPCRSNADCSLVSGGRNVCQAGRCVSLLAPGEICAQNAQCQSGRCLPWFLDRDRDGFGSEELRACSGNGGAAVPPGADYVSQSGDCCDLGGLDRAVALSIFPGQETFFEVPQTVCPTVDPFNYDCSGDLEYIFQEDTEANAGGCAFEGCEGATIWFLSGMGGQVPKCGTVGLLAGCAAVPGGNPSSCAARPVGQFTNACH